MKEKRPVLINCLDLDETLMKTEKLYERFEIELADEIKKGVDLCQLFENWLKNHFPKQDDNFADLISTYIIDSSDGKLAKAIKHALSLGDKFAIVTFNMSKNYAKFTLALMGLTKEEIDQIYIRYRDSDEVPANKIGYIMEAVEHFGLLDMWKAAKNKEIDQDHEGYPYVSLLDDNFDNCQAARSEGIYGYCVQEDISKHLREYCYYMHAETKEYRNVVLPTVAERFALAKSFIELKPQLVETPPIAAPSSVQQIVAQVDLLLACVPKRPVKRTASAASISLRCDDKTLDSVLAELPERVKRAKPAVEKNGVSATKK